MHIRPLTDKKIQKSNEIILVNTLSLIYRIFAFFIYIKKKEVYSFVNINFPLILYMVAISQFCAS